MRFSDVACPHRPCVIFVTDSRGYLTNTAAKATLATATAKAQNPSTIKQPRVVLL